MSNETQEKIDQVFSGAYLKEFVKPNDIQDELQDIWQVLEKFTTAAEKQQAENEWLRSKLFQLAAVVEQVLDHINAS